MGFGDEASTGTLRQIGLSIKTGGWPTFTFFVKVGIHEGLRRHFSSQPRSASLRPQRKAVIARLIVPTFTTNVKVGQLGLSHRAIGLSLVEN
jgi:hypothetical protein